MEDNAPAKQGTPLITEDMTDWGNAPTFIEPPKRTEAGNKEPVKEDVKQEPETTQEEEFEDDEFDTGSNYQYVEDPGQFQPSDHSFTVALANGKNVTVKTVEEADKIAEDPENFETPKQLLDFIRNADKMQRQIEKEEAEYNAQLEAFEDQEAAIKTIQVETNRIKNEFAYLVSNGDLPKLPSNSEEVEWAKSNDPAIKTHLDLIKFMEKESKKRQKLGLSPLTSPIDAYAAWQVAQAKKNKTKAEADAKEQRREMGSRVASSSPAPVSVQPRGIAVGRVGNFRTMGSGWN